MPSPFWNSLDPVPQIKKDFWKIDKNDLVCFLISIISTLVVWSPVACQHGIDKILSYWDGPNYLYAGATLYDIPESNPWTYFFKYPPSYFACHLPGYPILIRLCSHLVLNNYKFGFYLSIIVSGLFLNYSFRRLLIITNVVSNSLYSTILLNYIPLRLIIYHSVGASDPLFLTFVCLALIFYKIENRYFLMLLCVWGACFTRIEGIALGFTIGACYFLRFRFVKAFGMFLTFLAPGALILLHKYKFDDPLAYIHFNQNSQNLINFPPFSELLNPSITNDVFYDNSFIGFYLLISVGVLFIFPRSIPIGIFSTVFLIYEKTPAGIAYR